MAIIESLDDNKMRDKNRIPIILKELGDIWEKNPDLRLGQIITIATRPKNACPEIFYIEDDKILRGILSIGNEEIQTDTNEMRP